MAITIYLELITVIVHSFSMVLIVYKIKEHACLCNTT